MLFNRSRTTRIIAAFVTIVLSAQLAGAQVVTCTMMSEGAAGDHQAMMEHQHGATDAAPRPGSHDTHGQQSPGAATCGQTALCVNAPAVPPVITQSADPGNTALPIFFTPAALEARALPPDSPPPRI